MSFATPALSLFNRDFSGGFLDTPEADALPPGASPDAKNCLFAHISEDPLRVTLKKRDGHRLVTPTAISLAASVDGMAEYRRVGANQVLLAGCNGSVSQFDNASSFTSIVGGFTAGNPMRFAFQKGQCIVMDGALMKRIDSALTSYTVGFLAPTAAPGLATAAGPGVTGTYEGFATWYDPVTDHDSSPSDISAAVVFANQTRHWTKPAGAPPVNATQWRVWVRRTDTNEANYFRAGTFLTSAATGDETTSDAARVNIGPKPSSNDMPPGAFALMATYRGYAIGVLSNDTTLYISKVNDFESWNPSDAFKVANGRQEIRVLKTYGDQFVIQTPVGTFTLEGDQVPFKIVEKHTSFGCVSQDACGEVSYKSGNRYWAWDESKGPYWSDFDSTWVPIGDNRVQVLLGTINKAALSKIRFVHDQTRHLVMWAVPVGTSTRCRTILAYDYTLDKWLPPITGWEIGAFCTFTNPSTGTLSTYFGDLWGRVYEMFAQSPDGVPASGGYSFSGVVTAATSSTVTAGAATFYTGGDGMAGFPVAVKSPAGVWQWRRIQSNTATTITLDTTNDNAWITTPVADGTWTVYVGGVEWYWTIPWVDFGRPDRYKRLSYFTLSGKTASADNNVEVFARFNDDASIGNQTNESFPTGTAAAVWGVGMWGISFWASVPRHSRKVRANRACLTVQLRFQNYYPNQGVEITGYGIEADWLTRRRTIGTGNG